jgi:hypothetical protein
MNHSRIKVSLFFLFYINFLINFITYFNLFLKVLDIAPLHQKEYVLEVQDILKKQRNQGHKHVWLHSHRDDFGILYPFFN